MNNNKTIETELRYHIDSIQDIEKKLIEAGAVLQNKSHIVDHWFVPQSISNRQEHDAWYDKERGVAIRIREIDDTAIFLETKQLVLADDHTSFIEHSVVVDSYESMKSILEALEKKEFLKIDKQRIVYKKDLFEIVIDEIKGFGVVLEIEILDADTQKETLNLIRNFAAALGLTEQNEYNKSATVEAMKKLAKF